MAPTGSARARKNSQGVASSIRSIATDLMAATIVAALNIALAVSFAALLFRGDLKGGFALGLWALLMSMVVTGVLVNLTTSMPPISAGPDAPVVAVMTLLGAAVSGQVLSTGGGVDLAVRHVLLAFSLMTLLSGLILCLLGALRGGMLLRFVPYPVVGGFLAATGVLLMTASYEVATGIPLTFSGVDNSLSPQNAPKLLVAVAFATGLLAARARIKAAFLMPATFFGAALCLDLVLWGTGAGADGWFIPGIDSLRPWLPIAAAASPDTDWRILAKAFPEIMTCVTVGIISLIVKVSSIETSRSTAADFDQEFRANGGASIVAAPLGALAGSVLVGSSKTFLDAGARTRLSGVAAAAVLALVVLAGVDLPGFVPKPILAGLLLLLGYTMLRDALQAALNQNSRLEFMLALGIAGVCLQFGYVTGVLAGFVCACLLFAFSYSRVGVVRRHLTRASFSGDMERAPQAEWLLRAEGEAIQVYWLSGYLFFGSSEGLFETIRRSVETRQPQQVRFVVLDFAGVPGIDSSAVISLLKLRNFCDKRDIVLVCSGLATLHVTFERTGLLAGRHKAFPSRNEAIDWCEEQLLSRFHAAPRPAIESREDFGRWLCNQLGVQAQPGLDATYFDRKHFECGETIYRQGGAADTIDFIASGTVAVMLQDGHHPPRRVRRSAQQTVLGEMGFFRATPRAATIVAEGSVLIYTLSQANLTRLQSERPAVYEAFLQFVIRTLSDRLELAHKEIAALS